MAPSGPHTRGAVLRCCGEGNGRRSGASLCFLFDEARRRLGVVAGSLALGASRYLPAPRMSGWSAGRASDEGGHDVRGVAVQGHPGPVVTHRGPWVGM